jgi:hypothetical protein
MDREGERAGKKLKDELPRSRAAMYLESTTHPLLPSLEREGKPSKARRGELKPKQSFEELNPRD